MTMSAATQPGIRPERQRRERRERRHRRELNLERLGCGGLAVPSCFQQLVPANCFTNHQSPISDLLRNSLRTIRIVFLRSDLLPARIRRHADTLTCPTKLPEFRTKERSRIRRYRHHLSLPLCRAITLAGFTFVAGCAVGPNFHRAAAPPVNGYSPDYASGNSYYNLYTSQLSIYYMPDVVALNRRTVESLQAQADDQRFQVEATYLTLTSNVVAAAIQEALLRGQIAATMEIIKVETEALQILRRQLALGQVAGADVAAQEAVLAQAQASLPPLQKQLAQQRDLLAALSGHFPSEEVPAKFNLADIQLPHDLPVSLPVKLIEQRPDVRMAVEQLHSASAEIAVAVANHLPNLTLTGFGSSQTNKIRQISGTGTGYWTLAASATQQIFDAGTLLHKFKGAQGAYDQATAQYRSTVITAFQNVADSLRALQSDANTLAAAVAAENAAATSLGITRKQLELGQVGYLSLLTAEQTYQTAVVSLVQAPANRYADTAALFQTLGGVWANRSDVVSRPQRTAKAGGNLASQLPN